MNTRDNLPKADLDAFIDDQLNPEQRIEVLEYLDRHPGQMAEVQEMRHLMDTMALVYHDVPGLERARPPIVSLRPRRPWYFALSAVLVLSLGLGGGWSLYAWLGPESPAKIRALASLDGSERKRGDLLVHISSMDEETVVAAFNEVEQILSSRARSGQGGQVEIVANADGLDVLRAESPYADRVHELARKYGQISFRACGIAMQAAQAREQRPIELLPEAERVDAALEEILRRLQQGWVYVKG